VTLEWSRRAVEKIKAEKFGFGLEISYSSMPEPSPVSRILSSSDPFCYLAAYPRNSHYRLQLTHTFAITQHFQV